MSLLLEFGESTLDIEGASCAWAFFAFTALGLAIFLSFRSHDDTRHPYGLNLHQ